MYQESAEGIIVSEHVYRPSWRSSRMLCAWTLSFVFSACLYYLLSGIPFFGEAGHRSIGGAVIWAIGFTGVMLWSWSARISLTTDTRGLIYRTGYATIVARWADVERIGTWRWPSPTAWGAGLVLRRGGPQLPWWNRAPGMGARFIPLTQFDPHWQENQLGDDLRCYAPWLFPSR